MCFLNSRNKYISKYLSSTYVGYERLVTFLSSLFFTRKKERKNLIVHIISELSFHDGVFYLKFIGFQKHHVLGVSVVMAIYTLQTKNLHNAIEKILYYCNSIRDYTDCTWKILEHLTFCSTFTSGTSTMFFFFFLIECTSQDLDAS